MNKKINRANYKKKWLQWLFIYFFRNGSAQTTAIQLIHWNAPGAIGIVLETYVTWGIYLDYQKLAASSRRGIAAIILAPVCNKLTLKRGCWIKTPYTRPPHQKVDVYNSGIVMLCYKNMQ